MDHWNEMRTAYTVARLGTVSAAAEALGLHRATVVRHVDALEAALGGRLFQRHPRGYTTTEAGDDMLRIAATTDEQFRDLRGRMQGAHAAVSGELVVTSIAITASLVLPFVRRFCAEHPDVHVRYETGPQVLRLEYGEAHVAVRTGQRPVEPDNVVRPWRPLQSGLYVHEDYVALRGMPDLADGLVDHHLVVDTRGPLVAWMEAVAPNGRVVLSTADDQVSRQAVRDGVGVGFLPVHEADALPGLLPVCPPRDAWALPQWIVTHVDLHRTAKVRAFTRVLRGRAG